MKKLERIANKKSKMLRIALALVLAALMTAGFASCKEEGDITPGPTAKPENPTVIVNNEAPAEVRTISVSGFGEVTAAPDFSTITIVAIGSSATSEEATAKCEAATEQIKQIADAQGVSANDLTTSGVTLSSNTRESDGVITGYVARETVTIIETELSLVNTILSSIIDARIIESYEVTHSLLDASAAYNGALAAAMADAQEKAEAIAAAGGLVITNVISVLEAPIENQLVGVAFKSSSIAVTANLNVTYSVKTALPQG